MQKPFAIAACLIALAFAGCTESSETQEGEDPVVPFGGKYPTSGPHESVLLEMPFSQNGTVASFQYVLPDIALQDGTFGQEVTLRINYPETVTEAVVMVLQKNSYMEILSAGFAADVSITNRGLLSSDDPLAFQVYLPETQPGDELYLVAGVRATEDAWLALTFNDTPIQSIDGLVSPIVLPPLHIAQGVQVGLYADVSISAIVSLEMTTPWVTVVDRIPVDTRPAITARDASIRSSGGPGFSTIFGAYIGYESHGTMEYQHDLHGNQGAGSGFIFQDWANPQVLSVEVLAFGLPIFAATGEGNETTQSQMDILVTNVDVLELLIFEHLWFGATMEELFGLGVQQTSADAFGLVQNAPYVKDGHLVLPGNFNTYVKLP